MEGSKVVPKGHGQSSPLRKEDAAFFLGKKKEIAKKMKPSHRHGDSPAERGFMPKKDRKGRLSYD
jgi:hypothetical protein